MSESLELPPLDAEIEALLGAPVEADPHDADALAPGNLADGTVETVDDEWVYVRLSDEIVGRCPLDDAGQPGSTATPAAGDAVRVLIEVDLGDGRVGVSIGKAILLDTYRDLRRAAKERRRVVGRINQVVRGGFAVDAEGVRAFLPGRESGIARDASFDAVGKTLHFDITKFDRRKAELVVTRRQIAAAGRKANLRRAMETLEIGETLIGTVTALQPYGVFVDLGGVEGLCHVSELSLQHVDHPSEVVQIGDDIEVKIVGVDSQKGRVSLSRRDLLSAEKNARLKELGLGELITGTVTRLAEFGAFIEIQPGVDGLCHISEFSWTERVNHPSEVLEVGQEVQVKVLDVDPATGRIGLSLRATKENPWDAVAERYPVGEAVTGTITRIEDYGLFVQLEEGVEGLCHISDLVWDGRPARPTDVEDFAVGQEIEVKVLELELGRGRIKLGRKQLTDDPWDAAGDRVVPGTVFVGTVTRFDERAAYLEIAPNLEGRLHISEISVDRVDSVRSALRMNQEVEVMTKNVDRSRRRIDLSIKAIAEKIEAETPKSYEDEGPLNTLGEALRTSGVVEDDAGQK